MGENSQISWTHHTFNAWIGCARVSPGCTACYAESLATKRMKLPVWGVDAPRKALSESYWKKPHAWNRKAAKLGERHRVFCSSLADVFEIPPPRNTQAVDVQSAARERLWELIEATPHLDWLLLTKRPENIAKLAPWSALVAEGRYDDRPAWPHNVWIGTTIEDQKRAEERIPWLIEVPAAVRFVSCEPLLESVDLENVEPYYIRDGERKTPFDPTIRIDALRGHVKGPDDMLELRVDWVIVGGESGPGSRPFDVEWVRSIVKQCQTAKVPVFCKQLGAHPRSSGIQVPGEYFPSHVRLEDDRRGGFRVHLRDRMGGAIEEFPEDLRIREFPTTEAS